MKNALAQISERLRTRIRVAIWKQHKKTQKSYKSLRKLGANHSNLYRTVNCRKSYQYICKSATIKNMITNLRLDRGLVFPLALYLKVHV